MSSDLQVAPPPVLKPNAKHISRACLECRHRHVRCDGGSPKCSRCTKNGKECSYVKSHRGGSRKKGVKKAKLNPLEAERTLEQRRLELPCVGADGKVGSCPNGHTESSCALLADNNFEGLDKLPCHLKDNNARTQVTFETMRRATSNGTYLKQQFDVDAVLHNYYAKFHNAHPVLPPLSHMNEFLERSDNPKELLAVMKIIGDGYTTSKYAKDINAVFDVAMEISSLINSGPKDLISLQTLILVSLVCHISALHDFSTTLRKQAIELALTLDINNLDIERFVGEDINGNVLKDAGNRNTNGLTPSGSSTEELNVNFFNTQRVRNLEEVCLKDCARRCFWELFFLDIIIGCADGKTLSTLAQKQCFVNYPSDPPRAKFDYETRAHCSKLVDESVRLNNIIFSNMSIGQQYTKLTASLSNWELKFSNPDFYQLPYLIDQNGTVNEGVHQGIIMLNYAKIFTHRPLSFLWRSDIPRNLKCVEFLSDQLKNDNDNCQDLPTQKDLINSRKIIETRKTIDAANSIAKTLIDTNPVDVLKRTPLSACSMAFAGLVHLSAYLWSSQIVQTQEQHNLNICDLNIYEEYLKLELSGIYQISTHFYLSAKIANYLMDNVQRLLPSLYSKIQHHFKHYSNARDPPATITRSPNAIIPMNESPSMNSNEALSNNITYSLAMEGNSSSDKNFSLTTPSSDEPPSPQSDTGCNWIDKNQMDFDFSNMEFGGFDIDSLNAIEELFKANN